MAIFQTETTKGTLMAMVTSREKLKFGSQIIDDNVNKVCIVKF